jgi:glycosyltransferase involved in cell wall biosynthesis
MLRVLQVIPTLDRSGAEKQMVMLATGLPRDRFAVEVAALTRLGPFAAELRAAGVPVWPIGKRLKADPAALVRLSKRMQAGRFDVVQTWIYAANVYGRIAARWARVPVVLTCEMAADQWKGRTERAIDRRLAAWTDRVVGNSQAVVDFYRDAVGIPASKLCRIDSGIGPAPALDAVGIGVREELGIAPGVPLVVFAGRLARQKGVDVLLDALDLLQHIRPDLTTLIAGDGPERARLEERARAFTLLGGRTRFLGHREDVPRLMAAADVVVLPSRYEGLPNVLLEAMQLGKPVVATAAPGSAEVIVDRETGRLVPVDESNSLARAIRDLVDDPAEAQRLGEAGQRRVAAVYPADRMIAAFADLYETLARARGVGG